MKLGTGKQQNKILSLQGESWKRYIYKNDKSIHMLTKKIMQKSQFAKV